MDLTDAKPPKGARPKKKRECRGHAGYGGKTGGRGMKGQKARAGTSIPKAFEGGQMPLYRRVPKHQRFPHARRLRFTALNVRDLARLGLTSGQIVDRQLLEELGVIDNPASAGIKLLAEGEIDTPLEVRLQACSASARAKIEAAGGTVQLAS